LSDSQPAAPEPEIRPKWSAILVVALVAVVLLVLGVLFVRSISARLDAARVLDKATTVAKTVDADVVAIDRAVRVPIDEQSAETKALAAKRIAPARTQLKQVVVLVDKAYGALNDDEREQALLLRATADTRLEMLALAEPILTADAQAAAAADDLTAGWDHLVSAKSRSKDAAAQYNRLTKPGVTLSNRLLLQVRSQLTSANADFKAAGEAFPSLDTKPYLTYIESLLKLNSLAIQSNRSWLKGQTAQANVLTTRYNLLEKQALKEAAELPVSPNKAIAEAYDQATTEDLKEYVVARKKATEADTKLRQR
jgi:hypothetical protein